MPRCSLLLPTVLVLLIASAASACSVPVFRYALEQWRPDPYIVIVFHRGELPADQQTLLESLQPQGLEGVPAGNVMVKAVDLDADDDPDLQELWAKQQTDTLPWMAVHQPPRHGPPQHVWSGDFNADNVTRLLDSPVRQEIRQGILAGASVVWVLLESGKPKQDQAAYDLLTAELSRLQGDLKLPEIDEVDLKDLTVDPASLKLSFSAVRLSRDDPREQLLVEMLLQVEPDLRDEEYAQQTMAFPVFGRGRALYALIGNGIAPETIEDASRFLTGACQCTVKAENPGVDLLMSVDWDRYIQPQLPYDESSPDLVGLGSFVEPDADDTPADAAEHAEGTVITPAATGHARQAEDASPTGSVHATVAPGRRNRDRRSSRTQVRRKVRTTGRDHCCRAGRRQAARRLPPPRWPWCRICCW